MGIAYESGRVIPILGRLFFVAMLVIPAIVGIYTRSWMWFFILLLVECLLLFVLFKTDDRWGLSKHLEKKVLAPPEKK
ncbi:MAG: hypothetical protein WC682_04400 [Parcubacteria group bacterium]|jgi:MFS family permease